MSAAQVAAVAESSSSNDAKEVATELRTEIDKKAAHSFKRAKQNYYSAYAFRAIATIASALAGVAVLLAKTPLLEKNPYATFVTAAIATVPALAMGLAATLNFDERATAWYQTYVSLEALGRKLKFENAKMDDVSKELTRTLSGHAVQWPKLGKVTLPQDGGGRSPTGKAKK